MLRQLHYETFILDLEEETQEFPTIEGFHISPIDETTIEVEIDKTKSCNVLFEHFTKNNIHVKSMRNKTNRLEQLFMHLVTESDARNGVAKTNDAA